jgi:hypothetical protein
MFQYWLFISLALDQPMGSHCWNLDSIHSRHPICSCDDLGCKCISGSYKENYRHCAVSYWLRTRKYYLSTAVPTRMEGESIAHFEPLRSMLTCLQASIQTNMGNLACGKFDWNCVWSGLLIVPRSLQFFHRLLSSLSGYIWAGRIHVVTSLRKSTRLLAMVSLRRSIRRVVLWLVLWIILSWISLIGRTWSCRFY